MDKLFDYYHIFASDKTM